MPDDFKWQFCDEAKFLEWAATRPERIAEVARKYPPTRCYRSTQNPLFHYTLRSFSEPTDGKGNPLLDHPITCTLVHGSDSTLPGVATFGQDPEQLIDCCCGNWKWPTQKQADETHAFMMARKRERENQQ